MISGVTVASDNQQIGVEIIDQGDVEGTVCDCGEILVAGAAFPKWPLAFLAGIPLFFIDGDDEPSPTPTPTPPSSPTPTPPVPTPTPIPEPATLFLFGTGLAAFGTVLRRRYTRARLLAESQAKEE